ncbi:helix-turn-helix domain-containing protein [Streptomyces montanisoli]|uniref:Helix-turn-helix transcriptional regulator n=1 Tax=Streptomyces montanisoli TaxID=2798581 RepID=A0A940MCX6_9ACTN|nr:helix-turn-helix domain-containing protein [Streptomyces montanisoli]MBP0457332.1 helix-turn-helix transcriptional regulator [Streptomyces montanisoli]
MSADPRERSVRDVLAANLKAARARKSMSLSRLARLSDLSKATLSQLESGAGNPTIETVSSLARALGEPLARLLEPPARRDMAVVRAGDLAPLTGEGACLRHYGRIESGGLVCDLYEQRIGAGERGECPVREGTEHAVVQAGRLDVFVDGDRVSLGPGDYVSFDAALPHAYAAPGEPVRSVLLVNLPREVP